MADDVVRRVIYQLLLDSSSLETDLEALATEIERSEGKNAGTFRKVLDNLKDGLEETQEAAEETGESFGDMAAEMGYLDFTNVVEGALDLARTLDMIPPKAQKVVRVLMEWGGPGVASSVGKAIAFMVGPAGIAVSAGLVAAAFTAAAPHIAAFWEKRQQEAKKYAEYLSQSVLPSVLAVNRAQTLKLFVAEENVPEAITALQTARERLKDMETQLEVERVEAEKLRIGAQLGVSAAGRGVSDDVLNRQLELFHQANVRVENAKTQLELLRDRINILDSAVGQLVVAQTLAEELGNVNRELEEALGDLAEREEGPAAREGVPAAIRAQTDIDAQIIAELERANAESDRYLDALQDWTSSDVEMAKAYEAIISFKRDHAKWRIDVWHAMEKDHDAALAELVNDMDDPVDLIREIEGITPEKEEKWSRQEDRIMQLVSGIGILTDATAALISKTAEWGDVFSAVGENILVTLQKIIMQEIAYQMIQKFRAAQQFGSAAGMAGAIGSGSLMLAGVAIVGGVLLGAIQASRAKKQAQKQAAAQGQWGPSLSIDDENAVPSMWSAADQIVAPLDTYEPPEREEERVIQPEPVGPAISIPTPEGPPVPRWESEPPPTPQPITVLEPTEIPEMGPRILLPEERPEAGEPAEPASVILPTPEPPPPPRWESGEPPVPHGPEVLEPVEIPESMGPRILLPEERPEDKPEPTIERVVDVPKSLRDPTGTSSEATLPRPMDPVVSVDTTSKWGWGPVVPFYETQTALKDRARPGPEATEPRNKSQSELGFQNMWSRDLKHLWDATDYFKWHQAMGRARRPTLEIREAISGTTLYRTFNTTIDWEKAKG